MGDQEDQSRRVTVLGVVGGLVAAFFVLCVLAIAGLVLIAFVRGAWELAFGLS